MGTLDRVEQHLLDKTLGSVDPADMETVLLLAKGVSDEYWAVNLEAVIGSWQERNNNQFRSLDRMTKKFLRVMALIDNYEREGKNDLGVSAKKCITDIKEELTK